MAYNGGYPDSNRRQVYPQNDRTRVVSVGLRVPL